MQLLSGIGVGGIVKRYGGDDISSYYKTYQLLEAEWANLNVTAIWLVEILASRQDPDLDKAMSQMLIILIMRLRQFLWFQWWLERTDPDGRSGVSSGL